MQTLMSNKYREDTNYFSEWYSQVFSYIYLRKEQQPARFANKQNRIEKNRRISKNIQIFSNQEKT